MSPHQAQRSQVPCAGSPRHALLLLPYQPQPIQEAQREVRRLVAQGAFARRQLRHPDCALLGARSAGLFLYGLQIASKLATRSHGPHIDPVRDINEERDGALLAAEKTACEPPQDCRTCPKADWCEDYEEPDEDEDDQNEPDQSVSQIGTRCEDAGPREVEEEEQNALLDSSSSLAGVLHELLGCHEDQNAVHDVDSANPKITQAAVAKNADPASGHGRTCFCLSITQRHGG